MSYHTLPLHITDVNLPDLISWHLGSCSVMVCHRLHRFGMFVFGLHVSQPAHFSISRLRFAVDLCEELIVYNTPFDKNRLWLLRAQNWSLSDQEVTSSEPFRVFSLSLIISFNAV